MIGLSAITFDPSGAAYLFAHDLALRTTKVSDISRRATRTATIDGGASLYDAGHSDGDRTIRLGINKSYPHLETVKYLVKNYSQITVTTIDGAFIANPNSLRESTNEWVLTLLVTGAA